MPRRPSSALNWMVRGGDNRLRQAKILFDEFRRTAGSAGGRAFAAAEIWHRGLCPEERWIAAGLGPAWLQSQRGAGQFRHHSLGRTGQWRKHCRKRLALLLRGANLWLW